MRVRRKKGGRYGFSGELRKRRAAEEGEERGSENETHDDQTLSQARTY